MMMMVLNEAIYNGMLRRTSTATDSKHNNLKKRKKRKKDTRHGGDMAKNIFLLSMYMNINLGLGHIDIGGINVHASSSFFTFPLFVSIYFILTPIIFLK